MSAFFRAGASLVPSPVTATTLFSYFNPVTNKYLSSGDDLANTHNYEDISVNSRRFLTLAPFFFSGSS